MPQERRAVSALRELAFSIYDSDLFVVCSGGRPRPRFPALRTFHLSSFHQSYRELGPGMNI
jgi:hypothetical protein